jgi:hypothetical protein
MAGGGLACLPPQPSEREQVAAFCHRPGQTQPLEQGQKIGHRDRWFQQTGLLFPHGIDHRVRSQIDHVPNEFVRMLRPDAVAAEDRLQVTIMSAPEDRRAPIKSPDADRTNQRPTPPHDPSET